VSVRMYRDNRNDKLVYILQSLRTAHEVRSVVAEKDVGSWGLLHINTLLMRVVSCRGHMERYGIVRSRSLVAVCERASELLYKSGCNYGDICRLIWAVAKLRNSAPMLKKLAPLVVPAFFSATGETHPFAVAQGLWAVAMLRKDVPEILELAPHLIEGALVTVNDMSAQSAANIAWASGVLGVSGRKANDLCSALCLRARHVFVDFKFQEWANMCWGLALHGWVDKELMTAVAMAMCNAARESSDRSAQLDLPQVVLAFARMELLEEQRMQALLHAVAGRLEQNSTHINPWGLCALVWSYRRAVALSTDASLNQFKQCLDHEISIRFLTEEDIELSVLGPDCWE